MGRWLRINGEAIYGSSPWIYQNDTLTPHVWYTQGKESSTAKAVIYAIVLEYPFDTNELEIYPLGKDINVYRNILLTGLDFDVDSDVLNRQITQISLLGMEDTELTVNILYNNPCLNIRIIFYQFSVDRKLQ